MQLDWTSEAVGRMHAVRVTGRELAKAAGITNSYLSEVLHKKKGNDQTRQRIMCALERLEQRKYTATDTKEEHT